MNSKTILITGATSGIGKATAIALAKMGATVIFTARDEQKGEWAKKEIIQASGNKNVEFLYCDLTSFDSIRSFCGKFKAKYKRLDVLINNAGVWNDKRKESKDGIEETFAVNFLAPFLMTNLLLDLLKKSAPSRIVSVTSGLHRGTVNFSDIEFKKSYSGMRAYGHSKLAIILFTRLLAKKLKGTGITVNCVHPGLVATDLSRDSGAVSRAFFKTFGKSPEKGAETSVYLAASRAVENITGEYFVDKKIERASKESYDLAMAEKLWDAAKKFVRLKN